MRGLYVYVAAPLSAGDQHINVREAVLVADRILAQGHIPFVPHLTSVWQMIRPHSYEEWMSYDDAWLSKCDVLVRLPGASPGADREVEAARMAGKPVFMGMDELINTTLWQGGRSRFDVSETVCLDVIKALGMAFHENARTHGFWDVEEMGRLMPDHLKNRYQAMMMSEKIALMHSELSEGLEAIRKDPKAPDSHCPDFTNLEVELADEFIRLLETACHENLRIGPAVLAKHAYNQTRPFKHGKLS